MLHTVNKSPFEKNSLETCLRLIDESSSILLIEDGVYGALKNTSVSDSVINAQKNNKNIRVRPRFKSKRT
jgi:tRNA 2-thiouridine synthesizing protein B